MVYYFTSKEGHHVYMGYNKTENEELIKYSLPMDVWFHVDNYSSAHVYIRCKEGEDFKTLSNDVVQEMCQLTRENSIEGSKQPQVRIVYTPCKNLKKTQGMDEGTVGFHSEELRKYEQNVKKDKIILKRIEKTKQEVPCPDLKGMYEEYLLQEKNKRIYTMKQQQKEEKELMEQRKAEKEMKSYKNFHKIDEKQTNKNIVVEDEDDFI